MVLLDVAKAIVFQGVADYFDVAVVQVKEVATVLGQVWTDRYRILIGAENQKVTLYFLAELRDIFFNKRRKLLAISVCGFPL